MSSSRFSGLNILLLVVTVLSLMFGVYGFVAGGINNSNQKANRVEIGELGPEFEGEGSAGESPLAAESKDSDGTPRKTHTSNAGGKETTSNKTQPNDTTVGPALPEVEAKSQPTDKGDATIQGSVIGPDGTPVSNAVVSAVRSDLDVEPPKYQDGDIDRYRDEVTSFLQKTARETRSTSTDESGKFSFSGLDPLLAYDISARADPAGTGEQERVAAGDNVVLLLPSLLVYGAGTATNLQARYAGTDLAHADRRATAVSVAMVSTTIGAVAGPNLVGPLGSFARSVGAPALAGPFVLGAVAYASAGTVLFLLLRPDPFLVSRSLVDSERRSATDGSAATAGAAAAEHPEMPASVPSTEPVRPDVRVGSGAYLGAAVMVITQMAMVAIMTMTPVHMRAHGHDIGDVGLVIGFHIGAMYLPSLVTGVLVDRFGRITMAVAAAVTLLAAGVTAATAPGESLPALVAALVLLGLGWNFGLISGTALVVDATSPEDRPRVQGTIDVGVALAGAGGGVLSGVIVAGSSYATLSLLGGVLSLAVIPVLWWTRRMEARHRAQRGLTVPG